MSTRERFWSAYYAGVVQRREPWLDYSNQRVQAQTFGLALEAAGPLHGKDCLDVGCGWGHFSRSLRELSEAEVTGVDIVPELVTENARARPDIRWLCGSLEDPVFLEGVGTYDVAFLLEVLQLVPLDPTLRLVWQCVRPGGRLVAMVPNGKCPIASRTRDRFDANYSAPSVEDIDRVLRALPDLEHVAYRGMAFAVDQRIAPYEVSRWDDTGRWSPEPNRIQFVALKQAAGS